MTKDEIYEKATRNWGYVPDNFGHLQKTDKDGKVYRLKFGVRVVRKEVRADICGKNEWIRLSSTQYSKI